MLVAQCLVLVSALIFPLAAGQSSGFYYDNGFQHVRERLLSRQEQTQMQHKILNMLGLPKAPLGEAAVPAVNLSMHYHAVDKKAAAPKFLMDVYRTLLDEEQHLNPSKTEFEMTGTDIHAMHESDVIMSFTNQVPPKVALRHQRDQRLWFNVSQVPAGESIMAAELRINKKKFSTKSNQKEKFSITLSLLARQEDGEALEKIQEVPFDSSSDGWILFNVTEALYKWVHDQDANLGLVISVFRTKTGKPVKPEEAGIVTAQLKSSEKQPFMVAFFKADFDLTDSSLPIASDITFKEEPERDLESEEQSGTRSRMKRDAKKKKKSTDHSSVGSFRHLVTDPSPVHRSETSCQLRTMYVSFADLRWKDWIIAPDGYAAYYCAGECVFPLTSHMNATNHAIVQTLVHLLKPGQVPTPCCAPIKLSGISVLYYMDSSANVILKQYKNMVVKACGCQ